MKDQTEESFLKQVLQMAQLYGWRCLHICPAVPRKGIWVTPTWGDGRGFPDLLLLRDGKLVALELKVGYRQPTPEQLAWLAAFSLVPGAVAGTFRPRDWDLLKNLLRPEDPHHDSRADSGPTPSGPGGASPAGEGQAGAAGAV